LANLVSQCRRVVLNRYIVVRYIQAQAVVNFYAVVAVTVVIVVGDVHLYAVVALIVVVLIAHRDI
jgi:hypothetical protein